MNYNNFYFIFENMSNTSQIFTCVSQVYPEFLKILQIHSDLYMENIWNFEKIHMLQFVLLPPLICMYKVDKCSNCSHFLLRSEA